MKRGDSLFCDMCVMICYIGFSYTMPAETFEQCFVMNKMWINVGMMRKGQSCDSLSIPGKENYVLRYIWEETWPFEESEKRPVWLESSK